MLGGREVTTATFGPGDFVNACPHSPGPLYRPTLQLVGPCPAAAAGPGAVYAGDFPGCWTRLACGAGVSLGPAIAANLALLFSIAGLLAGWVWLGRRACRPLCNAAREHFYYGANRSSPDALAFAVTPARLVSASPRSTGTPASGLLRPHSIGSGTRVPVPSPNTPPPRPRPPGRPFAWPPAAHCRTYSTS